MIRKTKAKAMLVEVCFCDNQQDVDTYNAAGGAESIAKAIYDAIMPYTQEQVKETAIMGKSAATIEQMNSLLLSGNPRATGYLHLSKYFGGRRKRRRAR